MDHPVNTNESAVGAMRGADHGAGYDGAAEPIAIVGMAARIPGAGDLRQFWRNLVDGVESVRSFTREEQLDRGAPAADVDDPSWVSAAPMVDEFDCFDAGLFGMTPREAAIMDPQHRLFLEQSYAALAHAGYDPAQYTGAIGVYAGTGGNAYLWQNVLRNKRIGGSAHGAVSIATANSPNYVATTVSYKLDLRGPSLTLHTACSTSLVAFHLACEALRGGECDMALAGGVNIELPHGIGYMGMDGFTSPDGRCRPFDADANGTVWGSGVGVTVLKRLADALADGDHIHAVVLGNAINNDGATKVGFSAPSMKGQIEAVGQATGMAAIDPRTITYVEAHGTGTALGDPIEVAALSAVYTQHTDDRAWCGIGSVKSNIGHLSQAAGIISVIKTVLAMQHGLIPPTVNFERPNPAIDFAETPFFVATTPTKWDTDGQPRRAGVSSFGIGGTNAHVVLEEAPDTADTAADRAWPAHLLQVSAQSDEALSAAVERLASHLDHATDISDAHVADVAHTLRVGRPQYSHRSAVVVTDVEDAIQALRDRRRRQVGTSDEPPAVCLMFSGQGAQHAGMGAELYRFEPVFAAAVDECAKALAPELGLDIRDLMFGAGAHTDDADELLRQTRYTQPALFTCEYALARTWQDWGLQPGAMVGHSIGEYVAASLAGVFTLPDALRLVAVRGRLMQAMPPGAMLAVQLDESELADRLPDGVEVATVNGPGTCVVAGSTEAVAELAAALLDGDIGCKELRTSHAFHSSMMEPVLAEFTGLVAAVDRRAPQLPFLSNLTGDWISTEEAQDPGYWAAHLRQPVRFGACVSTLLATPPAQGGPAAGSWALVECGPGRQLAGLARMQLRTAGSAAAGRLAPLPSLPSPGERTGDAATLLTAAGALWVAGVSVRPTPRRAGRRLPLPTYPFQRQRYWVDPDPEDVEKVATTRTGPLALADWFAVPVWRQAPPDQREATLERCLAFVGGPRGDALLSALRATGVQVLEVRPGPHFSASPTGWTLRPGDREDYDALVADLEADRPDRIVHALALDGEPCGTDIAAAWCAQDHGFFSLLFLAQALAGAGLADGVHLDVISAGTADVLGADLTRPEHATLNGITRVLPVELPSLSMRRVDVETVGGQTPDRIADTLVRELRRPPSDGTAEVAVRSGRRWVTDYAQVSLPDAESASAEANGRRPAALRERGRYLITGGLGGIGITLAEDFAKRSRARLGLLSRAGLPPREDWDSYLAQHGKEDRADRVSRAIQAIRRMEQAGAEVLVLAADVTDPDDLRRVRRDVETAFGGVDGIVHAAGVPGGGMAEVKDRETAEQVLAPKLTGTLALAQCFADTPLDFLVLCSSVTAVVGGFGQVDYCAANNFMDAYARAPHGLRCKVVSQGWGGWAEVGMAAEVNAPAAFRALADSARQGGGEVASDGPAAGRLDHPILSSWTGAALEEAAKCHGMISPESHWVLDEHRIGGVPVVPGTAHLECARAALAAVVPQPDPGRVVELSDVAFLEPLAVGDGMAARYMVDLTVEPGGVEFEVTSQADGQRRTHVRGSAGWVSADAPSTVDMAAILARCRPVEEESAFGRGRTSMLTFGPRWDCLRKHYVGNDEELALVEAPEASGADMHRWALHPALLDVATAFGRSRGEGSYLPLSYGRVVIRGVLPTRFYSHLRYRDAATDELVVADLTLLDEAGQELVSVSEFVMRRVDRSAVTGGLEAASSAVPAIERQQPATDESGRIRPPDGVEAFLRVLASDLGPQVVISPMPVAELAQRVRRVTAEAVAGDGAGPDLAGLPAAEPAGSGEGYVAPRTELEAVIAAGWSDTLGVDSVGVDDDFFALGGNSLVAVQLISVLRKATGVRLPMRSLFETPTVAGLAALIEQLRESADTPAGDSGQTSIPRLPRETPPSEEAP